MSLDNNFGELLTKLRKEKGFTQKKLGDILGVSNNTISKWEQGKLLPDAEMLVHIAKLFDISIDLLLKGERYETSIKTTEAVKDLLKMEGVYKYYQDGNHVTIGLENINLSFKLGEFVSISGVSGSGKTTLIKMIGGMDYFQNGEILINYSPLSRFDKEEYETYRRDNISFIFQDFALMEQYTVYENLKLVLLGKNYSNHEIKSKIISLLKQVKLDKFKSTKVSHLSGGQKQKIAVLRAILNDTPIIIGDEITANLDSRSAKEVIEILHKYSTGKLVLLVSHHEEELKQYATRSIIMKNGQIAQDIMLKDLSPVTKIQCVKKSKLSFKEQILQSLTMIRRSIFSTIAFSFLMIVLLLVGFGVSSGIQYLDSNFNVVKIETSWILNKNNNRLIIQREDQDYFSNEEIINFQNFENVDFVIADSVALDTSVYHAIDGSFEEYVVHSLKELGVYNYGDYDVILKTNDASLTNQKLTFDFEEPHKSQQNIVLNVKEVIKKQNGPKEIYLSDSLIDKRMQLYNGLNCNVIFHTGYSYFSNPVKINNSYVVDPTLEDDTMLVPKSLKKEIENIMNSKNNDDYKEIYFQANNNHRIKLLELENENEMIRVSDTLFEGTGFTAQISLFCKNGKRDSVKKSLDEQYITFQYAKYGSMHITDREYVFMIYTLFYLIMIILWLILYVLAKLILHPIVVARNKDIIILDQIGFSKKQVLSLYSFEWVTLSIIIFAFIFILGWILFNSLTAYELEFKVIFCFIIWSALLIYCCLKKMRKDVIELKQKETSL